MKHRSTNPAWSVTLLGRHSRASRYASAGWQRMLGVVAAMLMAFVAHAAPPEHPLKPPDRSSPRATIQTFLESCDEMAQFIAGPLMLSQSRELFNRARELEQVPFGCLDLHAIPPASRTKSGYAALLDLYEVLARIDLPASEDIPGSVHPISADKGGEQRWTIPDTEITLVRSPTGEFLFSPETVARAREFFLRVRSLPYKRPMPIHNLSDLPVECGGWLVPLSWVRSMPPWLRMAVAGQAVWKWIGLVGLLTVAVMLFRMVYLFSRRGNIEHPLGQALRRLTLPVAALVLTPVITNLALDQLLFFVGAVGAAIQLASTAAMHLAGAWLAWRSGPVLAEMIIASPRIAPESIDAHLIRIFARLAGIVGSAGLLAVGADRLGLPLYGIVAGLGVGGLALALSAQPTIENLIGGLSLFADKPMKVGDFGRYGDVLGTVEQIGIRSTRIRGNDRKVTTIPNAMLAKTAIVNFAKRDRMLIETIIGLRYETTPDQLRSILTKLSDMLLLHPRVVNDLLRVRFVGFGESSLNLEVFAYVATADWAEFLGVRQEIYLQIMNVIEQCGSSIAFPSQVLYLTRDPGLEREKAHATKAEVRKQRETEVGPSATADGTDRRPD